MVSFKDLKKNRTTALEELNKKLESSKKKTYEDNGEYWRLKTDSVGNGSAIIRFFFLPVEGSDEVPYISRYEYAFKGPTGSWYINNSRSSLGYEERDPVKEHNDRLYAAGDKETPKKTKGKKWYFANIKVIKDPAVPENEGKIFKYKFGSKIMDKIVEMQTPDEGEEAIDPFDLWEGVNFKLSVSKVGDYPNYDKSKFERRASPLGENDEEIETLWKQRYDLRDVLKPSEFKSYEDLKEQFERVMCFNTNSAANSGFSRFDDEDEDEDAKDTAIKSRKTLNFVEEDDDKVLKTASKTVSFKGGDDDDDDADFFAKLASE